MRNKKKKGFTLIELIAVIAILGILGAVLVPNIMGYINRAKKSNIQTSAKTIMHAIEVYNSDSETKIDLTSTAQIDTIFTTINTKDPGTIVDTKVPTNLKSQPLNKLQTIVDGNFTVTGGSGMSVAFNVGT